MPRKKRHGDNIHRHGSGWRIRWTERGRRRSAVFPTEDLARRALARIKGELAARRAGVEPDRSDAPRLRDLAEEWLKRRATTHASARSDRQRWRDHLDPVIGHLQPDDLDEATISRIVDKVRAGRKPATAQRVVRLLSTFYTHLVEQRWASRNPVRTLSKQTRALIQPDHDPRTTPFLESLSDVERIFRALPEPVNIAYAIGALAGLRPGELLGLRWAHIDLDRRRIHVREQRKGARFVPLKDKESRIVPILDSLATVLRAWRLRCPGDLVLPARRTRLDRPGLGQHALNDALHDALEALGMPAMTWYQATKHTMASQFTLGGGDIRTLQAILGHSSVTTTERYSHLHPDAFAGEGRRIVVNLSPSEAGKVLQIGPAVVQNPDS